jgi:hypothetical protein
MAVLINGRTIVHAKSGGQLMTTDICHDPLGIPTPYANQAFSKDLDKGAKTVTYKGQPIAHMKSVFAQSYGSGPNGGVNSGSVNDIAEFIEGSQDVFLEGIGAVRANDKMVSNKKNTAPMPLIQANAPASISAQANTKQVQEQSIDYVYDVDVVGQTPMSLNTSFCTYDDTENSFCSLQLAPGRLSIPNVPNPTACLSLRMLSIGEIFDIPLMNEPIAARNINTQSEPIQGNAPSVIVPCQLSRNNVPYQNDANLNDIDNSALENIMGTTQQEMLDSGWLYIYKDGFLWREVQIINGQYCDVDLQASAGTNERTSENCVTHDYLELPYKIHNVTPKIEIAYSAVQWSWSRVNYFGGMNSADPRVLHTSNPNPIPMPTNAPSDARSTRGFITVDLSVFLSGATPAIIQVQDPLRMAEKYQAAILYAQDQLMQCMAQSKEDPYFHSALLTYHTFFDPKNASTHTENVVTTYPGGIAVTTQQDVGNENYNDQSSLDQDKLEKILTVKERAQWRQTMMKYQSDLINVMNNNPPALLDLSENINGNYAELFSVISGVVTVTSIDPRNIDRGLDLSNVYETVYNPPGLNYLNSLLQSSHPLYNHLFPSDGSENLIAFQATFANDNPEYAENLQIAIGSMIRQTIKLITNQNASQLLQPWVNLLSVSGESSFKNVALGTTGNISDNVEIFGFDEASLKTGLQKFPRSSVPVTQDPINLVYRNNDNPNDPNDGKTLKKFSPANVINNDGAMVALIGVTENVSDSVNELYKNLRTGNVGGTIKALVLTIPSEDFGIDKHTIMQSFAGLGRGLSAIQFALHAYNLLTVQEGAEKYKNFGAQLIYGFQTLFYTGYALETLYIAFRDIENVASLYGNVSLVLKLRQRFLRTIKSALTPFALLGIAANVIDFSFALSDLIQSIQDKNLGTGTGNVMLMGSSVLSALSVMINYVPEEVRNADKAVKAVQAGTATAEETELAATLGERRVALLVIEDFFAPVGGIGWVALVITILAMAVIQYFTDSPLKAWAKQSPFAKSNPGTQNDFDTMQSLLALLLTPKVLMTQLDSKPRSPYQSFSVLVNLPAFDIGSDALIVKTTWSRENMASLPSNTGQPMFYPDPNASEQNLQHSITPTTIDEICDASGRVIAMQYNYINVPVNIGNKSTSVTTITYNTQVALQYGEYRIPAKGDWINGTLQQTL